MISSKTKFYRDAVVISLIFTGLCAAAWYAFSFILQANEELTQTKRDLATLDARNEQAAGMAAEYERAQGDIARATAALLDRRDKLAFIVVVERLAAEHGITHVVRAVEDAAPAPDKKNHIIFSLEASGSFAQVLKFVQALEHAEYFVSLSGVRMSRASDGGGIREGALPAEVKAQLSARVYAR